MKKQQYILILAFVFALFACEDKEEKPTLDNANAVAPVLLTPADASSYTLTTADALNDFELFTWSSADYGVDIALTYTLQLELAGGQFASPRLLARTGDLSDTLTVGGLNLMLFNMGINTAQATDLNIRVMSTGANAAVDTLISGVNTITVTPFTYAVPNILGPTDGSSFVLARDTAGELDFEEFSWTQVDYYTGEATRYRLQFDIPANNFSDPVTLYDGSDLQFTPIVLDLNNALLDQGYEVGVAADVAFRVLSSLGESGVITSGTVEYTLTPYSSEAPPPDPLYLLGSATLAGWDNTAALTIEWDAARNVHSITTDLTAGGMKILKNLGAWAPQWGDDGNGDGTGGVLIYRPDEATTDPAEIPSPGAGTYRIDIDIPNLTYTITPV
ncbi:MAG: SusE domain-containing protein [Bacteroidales bacterium]|nr:SusE domain-containing protein [Bacteroidales bacterium]